MIQFINFALLKWLLTNKPAQNKLIVLNTNHTYSTVSICKIVANEANKLHVVEMQNFLWIFFVCQIDQDNLSVIWHVALVDH